MPDFRQHPRNWINRAKIYASEGDDVPRNGRIENVHLSNLRNIAA
jgi:hypothetical protein